MRLRRIYPVVKRHHQDHQLQNCKLIVDAKSFFKNSYEKSGCQYILGGEYDRYADYLRKLLVNFGRAHVECFVVFQGGMVADINRRLEIHQKTIDSTDAITFKNKDTNFSEPAFVKDVNKQVLEELGIKFTICDGENLSEMVNLAKKFECAILTDYVECCLFHVPCILNGSLKFNDELNFFDCKLYEPKLVKSRSGTPYPHEKMAAFLVLMDANNEFLNVLKDLLHVKPNIVGITFRTWMFKQSKDQVFYHMSKRLNASDYKQFEEDYKVMFKKLNSTQKTLAVKHFLESKLKISGKLFETALASGKLTTAYINLRNLSLFSESWLIVDKNKEDAMLPSMDIVRFAHEVLTGFSNADITFVGRVGTASSTWAIKSNEEFDKPPPSCSSYFDYFLSIVLPGFDFAILKNAEEDCKLLIISLVYHSVRVNKDFTSEAYSIILSYVVLSQVSKRVGLLKRSNYSMEADVSSGETQECVAVADILVKYFYIIDGDAKFNRRVLHAFAEFEHVLTQMNYLNEFCGRHKCTVYHNTYNATFIHNVFHLMKEGEPIKVVESLLAKSPSVLSFYKNIVRVYHDCLSAIRL